MGVWTERLSILVAALAPLGATACSDADGATGATGATGGGAAGAGGDATGAGGGGGGGGAAAASPTRLAFGSCMHQSRPKPALELAAASAPDLFVFLGDNIYGDTDDMAVLQQKYDQQAESPELVHLREVTPIIATWDDHDYGRNDAGKEYPHKAESKEIFLEFWQEPADSPRRAHDGVYTSYLYEGPGGTLQVILLDTRWFRDPLDPNTDPTRYKNDYQPTDDTSRTMLGEAQWAWLEGELEKPADVRVIGTSTQLGHEYNGWESWTNMPHERQRFVDLVRTTGAEGVVLISGDVHWAELSRLEVEGGYPLYDLTSSGITEEWPIIEGNENRVGEAVPDNNYGYLEIDWGGEAPSITFGIVDVEGVERVRHEVPLSELRF
jgi:alkaline phosphatase D